MMELQWNPNTQLKKQGSWKTKAVWFWFTPWGCGWWATNVACSRSELFRKILPTGWWKGHFTVNFSPSNPPLHVSKMSWEWSKLQQPIQFCCPHHQYGFRKCFARSCKRSLVTSPFDRSCKDAPFGYRHRSIQCCCSHQNSWLANGGSFPHHDPYPNHHVWWLNPYLWWLNHVKPFIFLLAVLHSSWKQNMFQCNIEKTVFTLTLGGMPPGEVVSLVNERFLTLCDNSLA